MNTRAIIAAIAVFAIAFALFGFALKGCGEPGEAGPGPNTLEETTEYVEPTFVPVNPEPQPAPMIQYEETLPNTGGAKR